MVIQRQPEVDPETLPAVLDGAGIAIIDHTALPTAIARRCRGLRHVVFLGAGARSYMNPEELAALHIEVHIIKGYGDTAVAECAFALMWAAAKGIARMDREMRAGNWLRTEGMQLTGKTLGLIGFGGIAAEMARCGRQRQHARTGLEPHAQRAIHGVGIPRSRIRPDRQPRGVAASVADR